MYIQMKWQYARLAWVFGAIICSAALGATPLMSAVQQAALASAGAPASLAEGAGAGGQKDALLSAAPTALADGVTMQALNRSINPLWILPVTSFSAVRDRPIFSVSRRPVVNADAVSALPEPLPLANQRPPFSLIGVVAGENDGIGIFLDQGKSIVRLKTQDSYAGWTLSLVRGREATLRRGGEIAIFEIPNP